MRGKQFREEKTSEVREKERSTWSRDDALQGHINHAEKCVWPMACFKRALRIELCMPS